MTELLHYFALGLAFGAITVFGLAGAVRLDRYEADRDAAWRAATDEPTHSEKSDVAGDDAAFVPSPAPSLKVLEGGASDRAV